MADIGKINKLKIIKELSFGMYLDGGEHGEILIPTRYVPKDSKVGEELDVFLYLDSDDRLIATTEKPFAMVDDFAFLRVKSVETVGAFLDWGLPKDLLVPYREQKELMITGKSYMVKVYLDKNTRRIAASSRIDSFLDNLPPDYEKGQEVDLIIADQTDLGFKAIVNNLHWGILYKNEVFKPLENGQRLKGFIKKIREDEKIDLSLSKQGYEKIDTIAEHILNYIRNHQGYIPVSDKTSPDMIYNLFGISKKSFKTALGSLYKKGYVLLEKEGTRLIEED